MRTIRSARGRTANGVERGAGGALASAGLAGMVLAAAVLALVALAACSVGGVGGVGGFGGRTALSVGDPAPPSLKLSGHGPALIWTFNSVDCLTCKLAESSWVVRRLQHRSSRSLETVVVAVGGRDGHDAHDRQIVAGFLASERVEAEVHMRTPTQYAGEFGRAAMLPALYVVGGDGTVAAAAPDPALPGAPDWGSYDLDKVLLRLARSVDGSERTNNSNPTRKENEP